MYNTSALVQAPATVGILVGQEAFDLLTDNHFLASWDGLYQRCPFTTGFQNRGFVVTWYEFNLKSFLPIICKTTDEGKLTGLLTLAISITDFRRGKGLIVGAGHYIAEYKTWLAEADNSERFIKAALTKVMKQFYRYDILLKYVPQKAGIDRIIEDPYIKKRCVFQVYERPLMEMNDPDIGKFVKKRDVKLMINRLKRLGEITLEHITDKQRFANIFDELALLYDFRQEAKYNLNQYHDNLLVSKDFMKILFEHNLIHVSVLKLNEKIIASNVGVAGKKWVHLVGLNAHDPAYGRCSPGFVHFTLLGQQLIQEEYDVFDLTPGGDYYKSRLATTYDQVYEVRITNSLKYRFKSRLRKNLYSYLHKKGIRPLSLILATRKKVYILKQRLKTLAKNPVTSINYLVNNSKPSQSVYFRIDENSDAKDLMFLNQDSLQELLSFDQRGSTLTKWEFLEAAEERLKNGQHAFTYVEEGRLLSCCWLHAKEEDSPLPDGAQVLDGLYCHPSANKKFGNFLSSVAAIISSGEQKGNLYALVSTQNRPLHQALANSNLQPYN